nr:hypothetical protein [Tanacetum cinerariifolium]
MIAILEKYEHNQDFHQIVDFVEASHIRYALTFNPTVYVPHIREFWSTARIETTDEGTKILATVDGKLRTGPESSIRRNLKLNDESGIRKFSHQWKYLIHTIMQCLSPKSTGFNEFSSNIATALVCLATNRVYNFSKMIFDGMVKNVNNKVSKFLMYPRFLSKCLRMGQFGQIKHTLTYVVPFHTRNFFTTLRVNGHSFLGRTVPLFPSMLVTMSEGSGTLTEPHHTPSPEALQTSPTTHSSPSLLTVTTESLPTVIPSDTPNLRQYTRRARIAQSSALLPVADEPASPIGDDSQGDAYPTDSGLEADQDRENIIRPLPCPVIQHQGLLPLLLMRAIEAQELEITNLKARVKLLEDREGGGIAEQSGDDAPIKGRSLDKGEEAAKKGSNDIEEMVNVLTSLDAATVLTSGVSSTPYTRRKGKEKMIESDTPKKKKLQEQIYVQVARELEEEMTQQRKSLSRKQQKDFYISVLRSHAGWKAKHFKGMRLEEIKEKFDPVWKQMQDFIPIGSKEESERFKRKGIRLEQDSAKKLKTSEEAPEEKLKEMMELIPVEEVYVEALQFKHLIIDWELWALVKETLNIRLSTNDKEMELWVELKRLYEPDVEDQLLTHTQSIMHAPVEWKLYDTCRVHHVTSKDLEIFMLVEKDYPLRKGLAIVMICYKLLVENYSQMANDLILKIYKISNSSR